MEFNVSGTGEPPLVVRFRSMNHLLTLGYLIGTREPFGFPVLFTVGGRKGISDVILSTGLSLSKVKRLMVRMAGDGIISRTGSNKVGIRTVHLDRDS